MSSPKEHPTLEQILNSPAEKVPDGVVRDLVHPWSMQHSAEASLIGLYVLVTIVVLVRIYVQLRLGRRLVAEDYATFLTWIVYTGAFMPVGFLLARAPMGVHQWNITLRQFARYLFLPYVEFIIWGIIILLLKIGIILQYLRIFTPSGIRGFTFWALHVVLWANVAYYVAFTFIFLFVCNPRALFWDKTITHGKCLDIFEINVISAVICVVSDLTILLLPLSRISQLNVSSRKKVGLIFLFAIGMFACATSSVRLYYNIHLWKHQHDITHQLGYISFWGTAQIPAGFLIVCLPSVPKFVNHMRGKPFFMRIETSIRSRLHLTAPKSHHVASGQNIATIGGGGAAQQKKGDKAVISDIEFHSLVNKTETSVVSRTDSGGQV
ncbi:hypothetical protein P171DRAFT_516866 [Karstenula rhodostoma CBS 690.94]|uniref:Rhodopsin domain-containing protein n=1 Tax=Karstenula rhodostoma CBS 690.94 TaxID=1392251 RepID=A0A9P4PTJ0_9PLEO|nr:hypothetical protein P171DRAFT_516866 [Karstenula rhodostoma CBS 690.94]